MQRYFWQDPEGRRDPQKQIWRVGRALTSESLHFRKASGFEGSRGESGLLDSLGIWKLTCFWCLLNSGQGSTKAWAALWEKMIFWDPGSEHALSSQSLHRLSLPRSVFIPPFLSSKYSSHIQIPVIQGFIFSMLKSSLWYFLSQRTKILSDEWTQNQNCKAWQTRKILS